MLLFVFLLMALGLTALGYTLKKSFLAFGATGAWFLLAIYAYTLAGMEFDIYWALCILSGALTIASAFVPLSFREAAGGEEEEDADMADLRRFVEERREEREQFSFLYGNPRRRRRPPRRGTSLYR